MMRYTNTSLRRELDMLVALAGLGKAVHSKSGLTWSFGLWREHILRGMLWYVRGGRGKRVQERAPSWSWASVQVHDPRAPVSLAVEVIGPRIQYDPGAAVSLVAEVISPPEISEFKPLSVSEHETKYMVKVRGPLQSGVPDSTQLGTAFTSGECDIGMHRSCLAMPEEHPECPFHPDYVLPANIELYSLLVAHVSGVQLVSGKQQGWKTQVGLVLTPVKGQVGRYRRVGYFHHDVENEAVGDRTEANSLFAGVETAEVEIV